MEKPSEEMIRQIIDLVDSKKVLSSTDGYSKIKNKDELLDEAIRLFEPETALLPCPFCGGKAERTPGGGIAGCARCDLFGPVEWWNLREAGRWTPELVLEYAEYRNGRTFHKSPSEWLRDREGK